MKLWDDLSLMQRVAAGLLILLAAVVLPEIAFLLQFGGIEVAFGLILVGLTPAITWLRHLHAKVKKALMLGVVSLQQSASAKPSVFAVQAAFCAAALCFTGSGLFAVSFFMPAMVFNGALI
ncbi:hypothetical protein [uncultured Alteromonas sp.]|jgi:hypothetical protein|uniref:hypothetical protein n=1 Tax=uncultured Alteromonas sp. TaxID=179113 RepID=UPI0025D2F80C|nr:hypothetical protein [uncultured Alteromonas sp.]